MIFFKMVTSFKNTIFHECANGIIITISEPSHVLAHFTADTSSTLMR